MDRGFEEVFVSPAVQVHTAEERFGPDAPASIRDVLLGSHGDDEDDDEDDEDEDDDENLGGDDAETIFEAAFAEASHGDGLGTQGSPGSHELPKIPVFSRARMNLTALSQQYNLYFVAHQDKIYVYQPEKAPRILPPAVLIFQPAASEAGKRVGGFLSSSFAHQMNQIKVGDLGDREVLVAAYDDGDVLAFYTDAIAHAVKERERRVSGPKDLPPPKPTKPFFHDNVGKTAWGIAIHSKSRLLGFSSNFHEVTVFAFALRDGVSRGPNGETYIEEWPAVGAPPVLASSDDTTPLLLCNMSAAVVEKHLRSRTRTWRIVLPLGNSGGNIPTIAFCDDEDGNADRVLAADIHGNTWLLDIWRLGGYPILLSKLPDRERRPEHAGWGLLVLHRSAFRKTRTMREAYGLDPKEATNCRVTTLKTPFYDISASVQNVRENAVAANTERPAVAFPFLDDDEFGLEDEWEDMDSDEEGEGVLGGDGATETNEPAESSWWDNIQRAIVGRAGQPFIDFAKEEKNNVPSPLTIVPVLGLLLSLKEKDQLHMFFNTWLSRTSLTYSFDLSLPGHRLPHSVDAMGADLCILRTTSREVHLQPFHPSHFGVVCRDVLPQHNHNNVPFSQIPWDMNPRLERTNMLIHVPELNLVVAGCMQGRVALLRLTRPPPPSGEGRSQAARRAFRVEWILPRRAEEERRLRPMVPLAGIAVSPVPGPGDGLELKRRPDRAAVGGSRRFRLILHYMDHTILMYDIASGPPSDEDILIL